MIAAEKLGYAHGSQSNTLLSRPGVFHSGISTGAYPEAPSRAARARRRISLTEPCSSFSVTAIPMISADSRRVETEDLRR